MTSRARIHAWMLQPLFDLGLKMVFSAHPQYEYTGSCQDMQTFMDVVGKASPSVTDILILDYHPTSEMNRNAFTAMKNTNPNLKILLLLPVDMEDDSIVGALRAGADGYLLQSATQELLFQAVDELVAGRSYLQPHVTPKVLEELRKPTHPMKDWDKTVELTEQERMVIQLSADGLSNTQIADVLGLAEKTIRNLWWTLFKKLQMNDRTQAVMWAIRTGQAELR